MSGGAHDFAYQRVSNFIESVRNEQERLAQIDRLEPLPTPRMTQEHRRLREDFLEHLKLVADAMRAIEWEDSGDSGPEKTAEAIRNVFLGK